MYEAVQNRLGIIERISYFKTLGRYLRSVISLKALHAAATKDSCVASLCWSFADLSSVALLCTYVRGRMDD